MSASSSAGNASPTTKLDSIKNGARRRFLHRFTIRPLSRICLPVIRLRQIRIYARFLIGISEWTRGRRILSTTLIDLATNFTTRIERSKIQLQTSLYYIDVFNTGNDIYTVDKGFRKKGFFDFHQTLVAQFKTDMQFGWSGEDQLTLGSDTGLRRV